MHEVKLLVITIIQTEGADFYIVKHDCIKTWENY